MGQIQCDIYTACWSEKHKQSSVHMMPMMMNCQPRKVRPLPEGQGWVDGWVIELDSKTLRMRQHMNLSCTTESKSFPIWHGSTVVKHSFFFVFFFFGPRHRWKEYNMTACFYKRPSKPSRMNLKPHHFPSPHTRRPPLRPHHQDIILLLLQSDISEVRDPAHRYWLRDETVGNQEVFVDVCFYTWGFGQPTQSMWHIKLCTYDWSSRWSSPRIGTGLDERLGDQKSMFGLFDLHCAM